MFGDLVHEDHVLLLGGKRSGATGWCTAFGTARGRVGVRGDFALPLREDGCESGNYQLYGLLG